MDLHDNVVKKELQRFVQEAKDTLINSQAKRKKNGSSSSLNPQKETERDTEKRSLRNFGRRMKSWVACTCRHIRCQELNKINLEFKFIVYFEIYSIVL